MYIRVYTILQYVYVDNMCAVYCEVYEGHLHSESERCGVCWYVDMYHCL